MSIERPPELDARAILRQLAVEGVEYVLIGGLAAVLQGSPVNTVDFDLCFDRAPDNLERLGRALSALDARLRGVAEDVPFVPDATTLRRVEVLTLDTRAGWLDVLRRPAGVNGYTALRERADVVTIDGMTVCVASVKDLIAMKRAAGRDKDLRHIVELEAILRLRR